MFKEDDLGDTNELHLTLPVAGSLHSEDLGALPATRRAQVCSSDLNGLLWLAERRW